MWGFAGWRKGWVCWRGSPGELKCVSEWGTSFVGGMAGFCLGVREGAIMVELMDPLLRAGLC